MIDFRSEYITRRDARGMSNYEVAQASGVPQTTISRFCRGESALNHDALARLLAAVGVVALSAATPSSRAARRRRE